MNVVVFSGTTEGRELSRQLAALGIEVTVSVAPPLGQEEQRPRRHRPVRAAPAR